MPNGGKVVRRDLHKGQARIAEITILTTTTPYPSRKIRRIRACTHQIPQRKQAQYAVKDYYSEDQYANVQGNQRRVEKIEDLKVKDVLLTCDTSLEVFNNEFNRLNGMDNDLFTYEVEVANILCDSNKDDDSEQRVSHEADDDMGYDPSDVAFTEWLGSKGDDEVELTDEEFFDNEDEVAEVDCELKATCFKGNMLSMSGLISDAESSNDGWRRWESHEITYHDHDELEYENETHDERQELCEAHKTTVCKFVKLQNDQRIHGQDESMLLLKKMNTTIWREQVKMHVEQTRKSVGLFLHALRSLILSLCHCLSTSSLCPRSLNLILTCLDHLCYLRILVLDQHAHTLHHLESLLTISLDRLDIFEGRSCISEFVRKSLSLILELS
ncbi:hypothetical protein Tco_1107805 [Tanacetum coccineum]